MSKQWKKIRDLTGEEALNLLALVDQPDSDFNDNEEVMGWVNFDTREGILTVRYENDEHQIREANWRLTLLDGELGVEE